MSFKTHNTVELQVTSQSVMDSSTRNIILGAVFGVLAAVGVIAIIYYLCTKKKQADKDTEEEVAVSPLPERVSADTFTKNMGATQTTILDMDGFRPRSQSYLAAISDQDGFINCLDSQDSVTSMDNQKSNVTTTPDMFKNSPIRLEKSKKIQPVDMSSKEMPHVTCSVSALGVKIPECVEANSLDSVKVDIPESTDSVFKQPKRNSMSLLRKSFLRRNQVDESLTTDSYFQSSFSNIKIVEESDVVKDQDELTSSSERLKNLLEKDEDELEVVKDDNRKGSSDSVFLPETLDAPLEKDACKNDDISALVSPLTCASVQSVSELLSPGIDTWASVQSVSELLSPGTVNTCASVQSVSELLSDNQTSSSSFSFKGLPLSPEEVSKELDWDSSHEPLKTRTSVLKLCHFRKLEENISENPSKMEWRDASSSSDESPQKLSCVLEAPCDEEWDNGAQTELEWDDENQVNQHGTDLTSSFHITLSNLHVDEKFSQTPRKSSNASFSSAMSTGRTPLHRRLKNSCADYETAEED